MNDLQKYDPVIITNGENRVATMMPDKNGKWRYGEDVEADRKADRERIAELVAENEKLKSKIETIERNLRKFLRGRP